MGSLKLRIIPTILLGLILLFTTPTEAYAVPIQNLNGATGSTQTFVNDPNVTISTNPAANTHSLIWNGFLPISRGGTGVGSFTQGSIPFIWDGVFSEDYSNFFWDNTNKRLGIGTAAPSSALEVSGNAKVTSLASTNDATINGLTIGLGGGSGIYNTALGVDALSNNTGNESVAIGFNALSGNTGVYNTAIGSQVGGGGGSANTVIGRRAGGSGGAYNSAVGYQSLVSNTTGTLNSALGSQTLEYNSTGVANVAIGHLALDHNTTGSLNVALGRAAFYYLNGEGSIAIGDFAGSYQADTSNLTTAANSIYIGNQSRGYNNNDSNSIVLGANAIGAGANTTIIGNSSMADVYFGSSSANANIHAKKLFLGSSSIPGCIIMGDSDGSGITYITANDGVLSASVTIPSFCQ